MVVFYSKMFLDTGILFYLWGSILEPTAHIVETADTGKHSSLKSKGLSPLPEARGTLLPLLPEVLLSPAEAEDLSLISQRSWRPYFKALKMSLLVSQ